MRENKLTATSYAILGQLVGGPRTTYEIVTEIRRNLRFFWPRAESGLYVATKALVRAGFAQSIRKRTGGRVRSVYTVTPAGRLALAAWLREPVNRGLSFESETLVRLLFADGGEADLHGAISAVEIEVARMFLIADEVARSYIAGQAPFQSHVSTRALVYDFLSAFAVTASAWALRAHDHIDRLHEANAEGRSLTLIEETWRERVLPRLPAGDRLRSDRSPLPSKG